MRAGIFRSMLKVVIRNFFVMQNKSLLLAALVIIVAVGAFFAFRSPSTAPTGPDDSGTETMTVQAYFVPTSQGDDVDCSAVEPVERTVPETQSVAQSALAELLEGPTPSEQNKGLATSVPEGTELLSITVADGVARANFNENLDQNVGGSCMVQSIRSQITQTLTQFPTVDEVVISRNGQTEGILQP